MKIVLKRENTTDENTICVRERFSFVLHRYYNMVKQISDI